MRLLVVPKQDSPSQTLKLVEVFGKKIPKYAILSHTWGSDEVLYTDVQMGTAPDRAAYDKVRGAMAQARKDRHRYLWVDTLCIQKTSSAELQEAINSMYAWYARAEVCYVYLADVHGTPTSSLQYVPGHGWQERWDGPSETRFARSRWFERGWTLQELIAPSNVEFFSSDWQRLGGTLTEYVATRTGISVAVLCKRQSIDKVDIGTRMSWVANRETSREEDMAYCMLGLFNVHMPLLYGEGANAFVRLQETIMRSSSDHTLFMWTFPLQAFNEVAVSEWASEHKRSCSMSDGLGTSGLLAPMPKVKRVQQMATGYDQPYRNAVSRASPYQMTNEGLEMHLPLRRINDFVYLAELKTGYAVYLHRLQPQGNVYVRIMCDRLPKLSAYDLTDGSAELIYIAQTKHCIAAESELVLRLSADTAARFKLLHVAVAFTDGRKLIFSKDECQDSLLLRLSGETTRVYWLVLQDPERELFVVIITSLPGWNFPMLGALPLRFSPDQYFKSMVQLEPAGVDIVTGKYTVSTAHASSRDGESTKQDLQLVIKSTSRPDTCETGPPGVVCEWPDGLTDVKAVPRHSGSLEEHEGDEGEEQYHPRIDALTCFYGK